MSKYRVELDLHNYAAKADLKMQCFNTAEFATEVDLASLQSNVDKLNIDKSKNIPNNLSNLKSKVAKLVSVPVNLSKTK